jgi:hypothetical protein
MQQLAFAHHSDDRALVDDRQTADVMLQQRLNDVAYGDVGSDRDDLRRHDVPDLHGASPVIRVETCINGASCSLRHKR